MSKVILNKKQFEDTFIQINVRVKFFLVFFFVNVGQNFLLLLNFSKKRTIL